MQTIFLPGFSGQYNGPEMHEITRFLESNGHQVYAVEWPHWSNPDHEFKADEEVAKVWEYISKQSEQDFVIIGKSIGTFVATKLLDIHPDFWPKKVLLMGLPSESDNFSEADKRLYPEALKRVEQQLVVLQNENDPFGSAEQVKKLLEMVNCQFEIVEGNDTHAYVYPEKVEELIA